jgi:hypothetical protein
MYKVPEWLIVEPEGLVAEADSDDDAAMGAAEVAQESDDEEDNEPSLVRVRISRNGHDVALKIRRKEHIMSIVEKLKKQAKVRASTPGPVQHEGAVGLGYCFQVPTQPPSTQHHCQRRLLTFGQLDSSCRIRLVYGGRVYHDHELLESHPFWDFANNYIVNALVLD